MKKVINILLAVCLMVSLLGVSALAAPATHSLPVLIDFENETVGQYYNATAANAINWFPLTSFNYIESENDNKYARLFGSGAVASKIAIKFNEFTYDDTVEEGEVQPTKLVVSFDADYTTISGTALFGGYQHILLGYSDTITAGQSSSSPSKTMPYIYYGASTGAGDIGRLSYYEPKASKGFADTDFNNHAYIDKINAGNAVTYTFVADLTKNDDGVPSLVFYIDDMKSPTLVYKDSSNGTMESINSLWIGTNKNNEMTIDNVRIYTVANEKIQATGQSVATTGVPCDTESVTVNFNHEIIEAADKYLSVKKGETTLTEGVHYTLEHVADTTGIKTAKSIKVNFAEELAYGTEYSLVASADYHGIDGIALGEETTLASFTTEAAPQINLSAFTLKKGIFAGSTITNLSDALGSTVCVTTTATNADARGAATGTVFFGVYKNDVLVSLAYVNKNFATAETDNISVNVKLPAASDSDTVAIKAFVCEGITNINPYGDTIQVSTAD